MRKVAIIFLIFTISFFCTGYSLKKYHVAKAQESLGLTLINGENPMWNSYLELGKLPEEYNNDLAKKYGDVISLHHFKHNVEKLDKFYEAYKNKELKNGDMIRITSYTIEGDPIIKDLVIYKNGPKLVIDRTRDKFANLKNRKITHYNIVNMFVEKKDNHTIYFVKTDKDEDLILFSFKEGYAKLP